LTGYTSTALDISQIVLCDVWNYSLFANTGEYAHCFNKLSCA